MLVFSPIYLGTRDCHHPLPPRQRGGELSWFPSIVRRGSGGGCCQTITRDSTRVCNAKPLRQLIFHWLCTPHRASLPAFFQPLHVTPHREHGNVPGLLRPISDRHGDGVHEFSQGEPTGSFSEILDDDAV